MVQPSHRRGVGRGGCARRCGSSLLEADPHQWLEHLPRRDAQERPRSGNDAQDRTAAALLYEGRERAAHDPEDRSVVEQPPVG